MASDDHRRRARLVHRTQLTETGTVRLGFEIVGDVGLGVEAGQFIGVSALVPGGRRAKTPYCIMSADHDQSHFELLIRVIPEGPVSLALGTLRRDDEIAFRGPLGRMLLPPERGMDLVMLATGVGVSPFLFFLEGMARHHHPGRIRLYWGLRLEADRCLTDELDAFRSGLPDFDWEITLSQPSSAWNGMQGRITESVPPLLHRPEGTAFMLCGNGAMSEEMMAALSTVGVTGRWMHDEPFFNQRHVADPAVVAAIVGRFPDAVKRRAIPADPAALFPLERPAGRQR